MSTTDLSALIVRVEAASEGSRELDRAIALEVHPGSRVKDLNSIFVPEPGWEPGSYSITVKPYTASIDAAMTLAPEGYHTAFASQDRHSLRWKWELRGGYGFRHSARAETQALAIVAAALKARSTTLAEIERLAV